MDQARAYNQAKKILTSTAFFLCYRNLEENARNGSMFPSEIADQALQDIKKAWHTILKKAGLEGVRLHDLRHTHASHLVSSGLSLSIVGKLLGHTQASTTQRYAHLADAPLRQATELFGDKVQKIRTKRELNPFPN